MRLHPLVAGREREQRARRERAIEHGAARADERDHHPMVRQKVTQGSSSQGDVSTTVRAPDTREAGQPRESPPGTVGWQFIAVAARSARPAPLLPRYPQARRCAARGRAPRALLLCAGPGRRPAAPGPPAAPGRAAGARRGRARRPARRAARSAAAAPTSASRSGASVSASSLRSSTGISARAPSIAVARLLEVAFAGARRVEPQPPARQVDQRRPPPGGSRPSGVRRRNCSSNAAAAPPRSVAACSSVMPGTSSE